MSEPSARQAVAASAVLEAERYVTIELFSRLTGFSVAAIRRRRENGTWPDGKVFATKDGTVLVDRWGYREWVSEGHAD